MTRIATLTLQRRGKSAYQYFAHRGPIAGSRSNVQEGLWGYGELPRNTPAMPADAELPETLRQRSSTT
jgi:hypothetical protein